MAFPEWTKKHKKKGIYIGSNGNGYFLYSAASVYDKEKKRSKKVFKEYLGIISEKDGFIPKERKFADWRALEFGLSALILKYCKRILTRGIHQNDQLGDLMICGAILYFVFGSISVETYKQSYLSHQLKDVNFKYLTPLRTKRITVLSKKINDWLAITIPDEEERSLIVFLLRHHYVMVCGANLELLDMDKRLADLLLKHQLEVKL